MVIEMVKNKYLSMSCEEKKLARNEFFKTEDGEQLAPRINRLVIYSVLLIAFGIYVIIDAINQGDTHLQLFYGIGLIIVAAVFFIGRYFVVVKAVNDYLIDKATKVSVKASKKEEVKKPVKKVETKKKESKAPAKKVEAKKTELKKTTSKKTTSKPKTSKTTAKKKNNEK